jgi:hypothetical protein
LPPAPSWKNLTPDVLEEFPMPCTAPCLVALALLAAPALASTDAEWQAFRAAVEGACLGILEEPGEIVIEVNPFGSASYGAALITVTSEGMGTDRMLCIYDKASKAAELTAPF